MDAMISRLTIFSLLLGLMLGLGIYMHAKGAHDRCNSYPPGGVQPRNELVVTGTRQIQVPCSDWWMRQPQTVQILCIADAGLGLIFTLNVLIDLRRWVEGRRRTI